MVLYLFIFLLCYVPLIDRFLPRTDFGEGIPDIDLFRICSFFLLLFFVIHGVIKKDIRLPNRWLGMLGLFYIIVIASISWSVYSYNSRTLQEIFNSVFIPLLLAIIAINLFEKQSMAHIYIKNVVIASFIMSLISVFQMVTGSMAGLTDVRAAGTFGNPNTLAIILVLTIPCILYSVERQLISEAFGKIASISVIIGIISTVSRKGIITMVIAYLLYCFLRKKFRQIIVISIGFVILGVMISGYSVVTKRFEKDEFMHHMGQKWEMVRAGVRMFKTSPVIGLGYKGYYENFGRFFTDAHKEKYSPHNIYINALANYGFLGFIPFLFIFFHPLAASIKMLKHPPDGNESNHAGDMAVICFSSLVPFMINGWYAGGLFYQPVPMAFLFSNVSLFLAIRRPKNQTQAIVNPGITQQGI